MTCYGSNVRHDSSNSNSFWRMMMMMITVVMTATITSQVPKCMGFENNHRIASSFSNKKNNIMKRVNVGVVRNDDNRSNRDMQERGISFSSRRTVLSMAIPRIESWQVTNNGNVVGIVSNHPSIDDGDIITTSRLAKPDAASARSIVITETGSKYRLGDPRVPMKSARVNNNQKQRQQQQQQQEQQKNQQSRPGVSVSFNFGGGGGGARQNVNGSADSSSSSAVVAPEKRRKLQTPPNIKLQYQLTGETVGNDLKYLLAEKPTKSTSGKSFIYKAYRSDEDGIPQGNAITIKISPNQEALEREASNYAQMKNSGVLQRGGRFVTVYEFLRPGELQSSTNKFRNQCALVMERGDMDLKRYLNENGPFKGRALRDAACAAAQCVESIHAANLVWTDLKSENFVVTMGGAGSSPQIHVKGIDLESAMPIRDNPVDYSPEACPPEFAAAFLDGEGPYFELQYSYDVWSLGMLFYELVTGRGFFDGKTPLQITRLLSKQKQYVPSSSGTTLGGTFRINGDDSSVTGGEEITDFDPLVEPITLDDYKNIDPRFKDLVMSCLTVDPKKRPSISQVLLHPYFLTTGFGPFSF